MTKLLTRNQFYYIFIIALIILPLLAPGLESYSLAIEPESFKVVVAVSASGILLLLWVISGGIGEATRFVKTIFYLPIIAFLIWNAISLFWAVNFEDGIFATVQYSVMALAFFLTFDAVYHKEDLAEKMLILFIIVGFLVSTIGLLQIYFPDSQTIQKFVRQAVVPGSTFGNKNMSSHFLVMILPISIILLWRERKLEKIIFLTAMTTPMLWFLFNSYTRTGLLALIVEIMIFTFFILFDKWKNKNIQSAKMVDIPSKKIHEKSALKAKKRTLIATKKNTQFKAKKPQAVFAQKDKHIDKSKSKKRVIIFSGVLVFIIGINFTATGFQWNEKILEKAASIVSGDDNGRLPAWVNTLPMIRDHFIIGVGSGNWEANYPYYYDYWAEDVIFNERIRLRRLHNSYLEILANVGVIGLSFLLWLLFLSVRAMLSILINPLHPKRYLVLGIGLALVGFSVSAMFSFPLRVFFPGVLTLVYIAIVAGIVIQDKHKNNFGNEANYFILPNTFTKLFLILLIPSSVLLIYASYSWAQSGHYHQKSIEHLSLFKTHAYDYALESVEYAPYRARSLALLGDILRKDSAKLPSAIYYLEKSLHYSPTNSLVLTALASSYRRLATVRLKIGDEVGHERAAENYVKTLHRLIKLDPRNVKGYAFLTGYHLRRNQIDKAKIYYNKMLKWADYFQDRNERMRSFGPYDGLVRTVKKAIQPHLDMQETGSKS